MKRLAVAAALAAAASSGCGVSCTMIGASSGVTVDLGGRAPSAVGAVEVCVKGACRAADPAGETSLWATIDGLDSTDPVEVEVKLDGRSALRTTVEPEKAQPNGPGCGPTAYQAKVVLPR